MKNINLKYLSGMPIENKKPLQPYSEIVCDFLNDLSKMLQKDREAAMYPDVLSFAFFCRKGNIARLKQSFADGKTRIGKGVVFHIAPSNVPINFAFTYVFGLLAGNANIVRVSAAKHFPQTDIVCRIMNELFEKPEYRVICEHTAVISYEHSKEITDKLSDLANVRVIWGGNRTISEIRQSPLSPRCTEITFADRFSFGIIKAKSILECDETELHKLAGQFYNDTYLMDQNACSTPHFIVWDTKECSDTDAAKDKFWSAVYAESQKYDLADIKVSDKYVMSCEYAASMKEIRSFKKYENYLYVFNLSGLPAEITSLRGKYGLFFEYETGNISELAEYVDESVQTITYFGMDKQEIVDFVINNSLTGVDRIVPFGKALDIGPYWDGYDIVSQMSRIVEV